MKRRTGFTLIELMVVVAILGVLFGLALPTVNKALDQARMTRDLQRSQQLGSLLLIHAQDNDGIYLYSAANGETASNSIQIFQNLMELGYLSDRSILGSQRYELKKAGDEIVPEQVGWSYVAGLTVLDGTGLPLLASREAVGTLPDFRKEHYTLQAENNPWRDEAVLVFYAGGNAQLHRADSSGSVAMMAMRDFPESAVLLNPLDSLDATVNVDSSGLVKTGAGALELSGSNTYNGSSSVSGGTLSVGGTSLGGAGSISSGTTTSSALSPGNSPGSTTSGNFDAGLQIAPHHSGAP